MSTSLRYLSVSQLSEVTGVDRRTIKERLADTPIDRKDGRAHYYEAKVVIPKILGTPDGRQTKAKLIDEQLKYEAARAEKMQIEVAKLRGEVVDIEEVAKTVEKEYAFVRSQIRAIPSKLAKPLSMITDPVEVHARIEEAINECLTELVADQNYEQRRIDFAASPETSGEPTEDVETSTEVEPG